MAANNPTRQTPGPSKDPQHVNAAQSSPGAGSEGSPAVSSAFDFGLHQFYTNTSSIRPAVDTSHDGYAKDLFDVEWDLEKYKKMNKEEQMAYKSQLMQAARRRGKDILKEMEPRFNHPSSTAKIESLKQSLLQMTKTQNAALSAAEEAINNPGKKTAELWQIVEPMRPHILHEYGAGMLAQLDALFQQEAIKEQSEQSPTAHQSERPGLKSAASDDVPEVTGVSEHSDRSQRHVEREIPMHIRSRPSEGGETERREVRLLKECRSRGEWPESERLIMSLSAEEQLQPEIAIHIGWNLIEQGYPERALDVTDRSWQRWKAPWGERPLVAALRLLRAYCRVVCRCELKKVFEAAWSIRSLGSSPTTIENLPDAQIVAEYWTHKLIQEAFKEGLIDEQVFKPLVRQRLTAILDFLHANSRTVEAALFEVVRCECSDTREERLACLRPFLTRSIVDPSSDARVLLKFAAILTRYGDQENAWTALRRAEECFGARGSGTCRLESRLIRNQADRPVNLNALFGLLQLKQEFRDLEYPDGELRALSAAASTASEIAANGGLTLTYYEELAGIARATSNNLQLLREGLKVFSALSSNPANVGKVIEGLQRCFETASDQMPASAGMAGMRLSQVYLAVGDREKSLKYANLSRECLRQTWKHELLSDATSGLARVLAAGNAFQDHMDALNLLQNSLKADQGHNYLRGQADKLDQLASLEGKLAHWWADDQDAVATHESREKHWKCMREAIGVEMANTDLMESFKRCLADEDLEQAAKWMKSAMDKHVMQPTPSTNAQIQHMCFSYMCSVSRAGAPDADAIRNIMSQGEKAVEAFQRLGPHGIPISFAIEAAQAFQTLAPYDSTQTTELYHKALGYLEMAESICTSMRLDLSSSSGLASLQQKRVIVSHKLHQEIYATALAICLALGDAELTWRWTQKSKARALSDMVASQMGSATQLESTADDHINFGKGVDSHQPKGAESESTVERQQNLPNKRRADANEEDIRSTLSDILSAADGEVELERQAWIFDSPQARGLPLGSRVIIVEWVVVSEAIVMLIIDKDLVPRLNPLDIALHEVLFWKWNHLEGKEKPLSDPKALQTRNLLQGLVSGLENYTHPDDLLLLCPSSALHGIPLHALKVGGKVLIERNFVVYTPSITLLQQWHDGYREKVAARPAAPRAAFLAAYEEEGHKKERDKVFGCLTDIAAKYGVEPKLGPEANRRNFLEAVGNADILHYHGHMMPHNNVLSHALVLSDGRTMYTEDKQQVLPRTSQEIRAHQDRVTVREVFSMRLMPSLVTLIACGSGVQDLAPGDEPLGLLSALFYAGAVTTVSTLWPVDSADGRRFAEIFYDRLREQLAESDAGAGSPLSPVNLAVPFTDAVRGLRRARGERALYSWAGYVMHGIWFL